MQRRAKQKRKWKKHKKILSKVTKMKSNRDKIRALNKKNVKTSSKKSHNSHYHSKLKMLNKITKNHNLNQQKINKKLIKLSKSKKRKFLILKTTNKKSRKKKNKLLKKMKKRLSKKISQNKNNC